MKRFLAILLVITLLFMFFSVPAFARAGGGGGGGGGGAGMTLLKIHLNYWQRKALGPIGTLYTAIFILAGILACIGAVLLYFKVLRSYFRTRRLMRLCAAKDLAWDYKKIMERVRKAFFIIQEGRNYGDMKTARSYLSDNLFNSMQEELAALKQKGEKRVVAGVKLKDMLPISVNDSCNDLHDMIWFRVKGKMRDYRINHEAGIALAGGKYHGNFVEFWQFVRNEQGEWVLNRIDYDNQRTN